MKNRLVEVEPGRWRVDKSGLPPARSTLPLPYVISDIMPPTEQVDGRMYTSKSQFRAVGRQLGLIEVGNEKFSPKRRASASRVAKEKRRQAIKDAVDKFKAGRRYNPQQPRSP